MARTALVTGANGFVGSHLADLLRERGYRLRLLVRRGGDHRFLEAHRDGLVFGDLRDPRPLGDAVAGADLVFHVAGLVSAVRPDDYRRVNVDGTAAVIEACRGAHPRRLVYVSSLAAVGPSPGDAPLTEDAACRPVSAYGRSKREGEMRVLAASGDLEVTVARPPAVYGPRDRGILAFFRLIRRGFLPLVSPPEQRLTLIHARDLAAGLVALGEAPAAAGGTYFLTGPEPTTLRAAADAMARALGVRYRTIRVPAPLAAVVGVLGEAVARLGGRPPFLTRDKLLELRQGAWLCSGERAARDAGFRPRVTLEEGMAETARWYREARWL